METDDFDLASFERRMKASVNALHEELSGIRAGRAHPSLLESIQVSAYGVNSPIVHVAGVSTLDNRTLSVNVWDVNLAPAVGKAIENAGLGLNPVVEGGVIRVPLPELSGERRKELAKTVAKVAEQGRVAVRNIRRDGMAKLKKMEKDKEMSSDQHARMAKSLQDSTDRFINEVDAAMRQKEADIMVV